MTTPDLTRRLFAGVTLAGVSVPVLAACGDDGSTEATTTPEPTDPTSAGSPTQGGGAAVDGLVGTGDVPVGGGVVLSDEQLVVTQPASGDFRCFSAVCTHQGCVVNGVEDNEIVCNCHGSRFSAEDGSVVNGPATTPLEQVAVTVEGDQVVQG